MAEVLKGEVETIIEDLGDKGTNIETKKYCRLCAKDQGSISIFDKSDQTLSFSEQVALCTQVEISIDDGLPSLLCVPCSQLLSTSYLFRQQCHSAQRELREIFQIFYDFKVEVQSDCDDLVERDDEEIVSWERLKDSKREDEPLKVENSAAELQSKDKLNDNEKRFHSIKLENSLQSLNRDDYECMHKPGADNLESHLSCKGRDCWAVIFNNVNENIVKEEDGDRMFDLCVTMKDDSSSDSKTAVNNNDIESVALQDNYKVKMKNNKEVYCCPSCEKAFKSTKLVMRHMKLNCKRGKCEKKYKRRKRKKRAFDRKDKIMSYGSDVDESECLKTDVENEKYKCRHCGKFYKTELFLRRHKGKYCKKIESIPHKTFMCDQCGNTFKQRCILIQHMRTHNTKMFSCKLCGKHFTRSSHVVVHMRIHNNYKPFVCETCGRSFTKSSDLLRHKKIHSDARNYSCPLCSKTFKRSGDIASHMRVHTGDRPYKCEPCSKSYSNQSSLRKHRKNNCPVKTGASNSTRNIVDTKPPSPQPTSVT